MNIGDAIDLIASAHKGQLYKDRPYVLHPIEVMLEFGIGLHEERLTALFHDLLEDTEWTAAGLLAAGCSHRVVNAVDTLTRRDLESYDRYIDRLLLSGDELAIAVKRADLTANLRNDPPARLRERYTAALRALGEGD